MQDSESEIGSGDNLGGRVATTSEPQTPPKAKRKYRGWNRFPLSKEVLEQEYVTNRLGTRTIGRRHGIPTSTVLLALKRMGIPVRTRGRKSGAILVNRTGIPSREELYGMYWTRGMTFTQIADYYHVTVGAVKKWFTTHRIPIRCAIYHSEVESRSRLDLSNLTNLAYILGVIEGDGSVGVYRRAGREWSWNRSVTLSIALYDNPFAESFSRALTLIGIRNYRSEANPVRGYRKVSISGRSKAFTEWWKGLTWESKELMVRVNRETMLSFIRGFYESEGSISNSTHRYKTKTYSSWSLKMVNTNYRRTLLVHKILGLLGYDFGWCDRPPGTVRRLPSVQLYLRGGTDETKRFIADVNPCIKREPRKDGYRDGPLWNNGKGNWSRLETRGEENPPPESLA